jgi:hypothetical protein
VVQSVIFLFTHTHRLDEEEKAREREKFEAWCKFSTPRQIGLFHQLQAELNEAA